VSTNKNEYLAKEILQYKTGRKKINQVETKETSITHITSSLNSRKTCLFPISISKKREISTLMQDAYLSM
jgi:hypothetical protein